MPLHGTEPRLGKTESTRAVDQPPIRRAGLCLTGGPAEPIVSAQVLAQALEHEDIEPFRPLLPVGYDAVAQAYHSAVLDVTSADLSTHYTDGLAWLHGQFFPHLQEVLSRLTGGAWDLSQHKLYAAGSDVDMISHIVNGVSTFGKVSVFPGDWWGFVVGSHSQERIHWQEKGHADLACLCVPSVRHGHLSPQQLEFLSSAEAQLLNLNLYPTLAASERKQVAEDLRPLLPTSLISISFSRGFGLTSSQLGVLLVPRHHPLAERFDQQWTWLSYFHNALAARAFVKVDLTELEAIDELRREWVHSWLIDRGLPSTYSGAYYVKSFEVEGSIPERLAPLVRFGKVRLCFKPPITR